jgi:CBS-domain-containing membrane protein
MPPVPVDGGPVSDLIDREPVAVAPSTTVADAKVLAAQHRVHHLLVVDHSELLGVVCAHDLGDADDKAEVVSCMSAPPLCVGARTSVAAAADVMRRYGVGCLPILIGHDVLGVVTRGDLRRAGVTLPSPHERVCAACGSERHVRLDPRTGDTSFCLECLERARPPAPFEDVGVGD